MEFNQSFTAPSIPKLNKRTIASPFGKKSAIQKLSLKKTSFSFIKKSSLAETVEKTKDIFKPLETVKSDTLIADALVETNQSLVEIKNQLEKFFALNIAEEKESLKKLRTDKAKKRFTLKENVVESAKKIGSGLFKQVDQVLAPTKSIFQKLIDFFGIILTGILVNSAFKWLENPENQKKVSQVFEFLTKNWKWILGLLGGAYVLRLLYKIYKVGKLIFGIIRLIKGLTGKKPPTTPKGITAPKALSPGSTSRLNQSYSKFIEGKANIGDKARLARRGFIKPTQLLSKGGVEALQGTVKTAPKFTPASIGGGLKTLGLSIILDELMNAGFAKLNENIINQKVEKFNKLSEAKQQKVLDNLKKELAKELTYQNSGWHTLDKFIALGGETQSEKKTKNLSELLKRVGGLNKGGTVKGKDKRDQDSVLTFLTVGEKVVRKTSSMMFGPLIDDLNDNAGRLWDQFRQAVIQLTITNQQQKKISDVFGKVIDDFNKFLEDQIRQTKLKEASKTGGGHEGGPVTLKVPKSTPQPSRKKSNKLNVGGAGTMPNIKSPPTPHISLYSPQQTTIKPVVKTSTASNVSQPIARARPSMVPFAFDLPAIKAPTPQVPSMPSQATDVPNISAVDMANPYIAFGVTKKLYGIYVV